MQSKTTQPTLVLLHGWSLDPAKEQKWQAFQKALSERGIQTKFLHWPGLSAPLNEIWGLEDFTRWLGQQLGDNQNVWLLGHSFGGQVAVHYAASHPQQIAKLVLLDSAGIRDHHLWPTLKRRIFLVLSKVGQLFFRSEIMRAALYRLARERDYHQAPPLLRRTMSRILDEEIVADLANVLCPTLIVWGGNDQTTPRFLAEIFRQKIPHNQFVEIDGARHGPQFSHPELVAEKVAAFLQEKS